jgi:hypothetical protein
LASNNFTIDAFSNISLAKDIQEERLGKFLKNGMI